MKEHNKQGFTIAELLIVVAIIAVLVGISIPLFMTHLERARVAVDQSNVRSAKAAAVVEYMTSGAMNDHTYYFNGGYVVDSSSGIKGYGKSSKPDPDGTITGAKTQPGISPKGAFVSVTVTSEGKVSAQWSDGSTSSTNTNTPATNPITNTTTSQPNTTPSSQPTTNQPAGNSTTQQNESSTRDENRNQTNNIETVKEAFEETASETQTWTKVITENPDGKGYASGDMVIDNDGTKYVYCGYGNWFPNYGMNSMRDVYNAHPDDFIIIDDSTTYLPESAFSNNLSCRKGTVLKYEGKYWVAVIDIDYGGNPAVAPGHGTTFWGEIKF